MEDEDKKDHRNPWADDKLRTIEKKDSECFSKKKK